MGALKPCVPLWPMVSDLRWTDIERKSAEGIRVKAPALRMRAITGQFAKALVGARAAEGLLDTVLAVGKWSGVWAVQNFVEDKTTLHGAPKSPLRSCYPLIPQENL